MKPRKILEITEMVVEVSPTFTIEVGEAGKLDPNAVYDIELTLSASSLLDAAEAPTRTYRWHTLH